MENLAAVIILSMCTIIILSSADEWIALDLLHVVAAEDRRSKHDQLNAKYKERGIPPLPYPDVLRNPRAYTNPTASINKPAPNTTRIWK